MEEMTLSQIKEAELHILRRFHTFCRENGIAYFLSNGTLLGAVKYKGFIPWDDDIDVFVPRRDYDRLLEIFPKDGELELLCTCRTADYVFPFAKLSDKSTLITSQTTLKNYRCGVHIDIFPLDYWPDDIDLAKDRAKELQSICNELGMSVARFSKGRNLLRTVVKSGVIILSRIKGHRRIGEKLAKKTEALLQAAGERYCGCVVWPVYGTKEIHPAQCFESVTELEFEGERYPVPIGYDAYLRSLYGEWEKDPPKNRQRTHHSFKAYRL